MKLLLATLALIFSAAQVYAFQETELPGTAAPVAKSGDPAVGLALPDADTSADKGTSITIPGLGTIGTIPKVDFGLELLYQDDETQAVDQLDDDGLAIKGRLKHSF
ncbi:MAG: hypothetical protein DHS20C08_05890 [Rhodomicrobium sp.]|nr:MAG: hypothetical protein DHS20C08_05890 [Rhodomicrobium sp.]